METTKICNTCHIRKPLEDFHVNKKSKYGRHDYCRVCARLHVTKTTIEARKNGWLICNTCNKKKDITEFDGVINIRKTCKQCRTLLSKEYYLIKRQSILTRTARRRTLDPERIKKERRISYLKNKEAYYLSNRRRRERKLLLTDNKLTSKDVVKIKNKFNNKCFKCNSENKLALDHHYPLSKGYILTENNCVLLCRKCNSAKGTKNPQEFYNPKELLQLKELGVCDS